MAICKNYEKEMDNVVRVCPYCGVVQDDTGSFGWGLLGFSSPSSG